MTTEPKSRERMEWEEARYAGLCVLVVEAEGKFMSYPIPLNARYNVRLRAIIQSIRQLQDDLADL